MKPSGPLTPAEKAVFGEDAVRGPDGVPIERGIRWSGSSPEACAEAAGCSASQDEPVAAEPPSQPEQRTIDIRQIHPIPTTVQ
jgi:hypothetical protein